MQPAHLVVFVLALALTVTALLVIQQRKQIRGLRQILNHLLHYNPRNYEEGDEKPSQYFRSGDTHTAGDERVQTQTTGPDRTSSRTGF